MTALEAPVQKQHQHHHRTPKAGRTPLATKPSGRRDGKYRESISQLRDIFPNWSPDDLQQALEDLAGDVELVISRISEGHVSMWSEAGKRPTKKDEAGLFKPVSRTNVPRTNNRLRERTPSSKSSAPRQMSHNAASVNSAPIPTVVAAGPPFVVDQPSSPDNSEVAKATTTSRDTEASPSLAPESTSSQPTSSTAVLRYSSSSRDHLSASLDESFTSLEDSKKKEEEESFGLPAEPSVQNVSIVEEVEKLSLPISEGPVVQLPDRLSSHLASFSQPVVILPSKINVRANPPLNFSPTLPTTVENLVASNDFVVGSASVGAVPADSARSSPSSISRSPEKGLGVEHAVAASSAAVNRHQPIQRPALPARDTPLPPPGLSPESVFDPHLASYGRRPLGTVGMPVATQFSSPPYGHHQQVADGHKMISGGFTSAIYPPQGPMKPSQQNSFYPRSPSSSAGTGGNGTGSSVSSPSASEVSGGGKNAAAAPPGMHSQGFVGSPSNAWPSYPPSAQHSSYCLQTPHYAQHYYPDSSAYHLAAHASGSHLHHHHHQQQQQQQQQPVQGAYNLHQPSGHRYSSQASVQPGYGSASSFQPHLYSVHQPYYTSEHHHHHQGMHPRPPNSPIQRQASGGAFSQKHSA